MQNPYFTSITSSSVTMVAGSEVSTDLLLITTNTADELSGVSDIDDPERP